MTILAWGWLWFQYIRPFKKSTPEQLEIVIDIINREHSNLGPMTWAEKTVGSVFAILAFLWLTRKPGFVSGWADIPGLNIRDDLGRPFITDASVAVFMAFWLFILPATKPESGKPPPPAILTFKQATTKLPWGVIFILGGGFGMAEGVNVSGLADWIGAQLTFLKGMPEFAVVVICSTIVCFTSQAASNSATITIFLPVLKSLASVLLVNPLLLMVPATATVSYAFMLPVSTPPNAVAFGYGFLKVPDMVKTGFVLCLMGIFVMSSLSYGFLGNMAFPDMNNACADWWLEMESSNQALVEKCNNGTSI